MFKSIIRMLMSDGSDWRFWSNLAKILIILLCVTVIAVIAWRKKNNVFCKTCKRRVKKFSKYCDYCGAEMTPNNKEVIIGVSKKTKMLSSLAAGILTIAIGFSAYQAATNFELTAYGTGMYSGYEQTYINDENTWGIECKKALSDGSFHREIALNDESIKVLSIDSQSSFGTLVLNVQQGDKKKQIDISNTDGIVEVDVSDFNADSKIALDVEHTKVEDVQFKISW